MILYFSATGNCKYVAQRLAAARRTACAMSTAGSRPTAAPAARSTRAARRRCCTNANWSDVTDFEFIPVISSREMREKMAQEA